MLSIVLASSLAARAGRCSLLGIFFLEYLPLGLDFFRNSQHFSKAVVIGIKLLSPAAPVVPQAVQTLRLIISIKRRAAFRCGLAKTLPAGEKWRPAPLKNVGKFLDAVGYKMT